MRSGFFSTFSGLSSLNDRKFQEHLEKIRILPLRWKFAEIPLFFPFDFGKQNLKRQNSKCSKMLPKYKHKNSNSIIPFQFFLYLQDWNQNWQKKLKSKNISVKLKQLHWKLIWQKVAPEVVLEGLEVPFW